MIPLRVYLKNFLCYSEQEFVFDGQPVWLLHGPNGVGKSAIFDAMIFSLFGEHSRREGSDNTVADLIRFGESSMRVEFDFQYRDSQYRVWRTRSRSGQPKQGVFEFASGSPVPRPVRDVNSVRELEQWIKHTLGLTYDAFVSAVLLRQGAAERLIDARRDARRDLFRGIIDIEAYIRLHNAVTIARSEANGVVRSLRQVVDHMEDVTDAQIETAVQGLNVAANTRERALAEEAASRERLNHARTWDRLNETRLTLMSQLHAARDRAARADELKRSVIRLHDLRELVPAINRLTVLKGLADFARGTCESLRQQHQNASSQQGELEANADRIKQRIGGHRARLIELDRCISTTMPSIQRLRTEIKQAEQAADLHRQIDEAKSRRFDPELDSRLARGEDAVVESQSARDAYPHLDVMVRNRDAYLLATTEAQAAREAEANASTELDRLKLATTEANKRAELARERSQYCGHAVAVAEARLSQARDRFARFGTVAGAAVCSECGQTIDAAHAERERRRLERNIHDAEQETQECQKASRIATQATETALGIAEKMEFERRGIEKGWNDATRNRRDSDNRASVSRVAFENARSELSSDFASRVAAIDAPGFPTEQEVRRVRETGRQLQERINYRNDHQRNCQERNRNVESIKTLAQAIAAIGAPADVASARKELSGEEERLAELNLQRAAEDRSRTTLESTERELVERIGRGRVEVNRLAASLGGAEVGAANARQAYEAAVAALSQEAVELDAKKLAGELEQLEASGMERDFEALAGDRALIIEWERNLDVTERLIERTIPIDACRPSSELAPMLELAENAHRQAEQLHRLAEDELSRLNNLRKRRAETQEQLLMAERNHSLHDRLASLLGPEGIQLFLLRSAERRIIDMANTTLNHISRGELRFEPPDQNATQALDLSVRRRCCPEPIPVGNLSGGQRCRVAISLALAVCRFACGEAHPLQSIIIDEAFANLDREGRMEMIKLILNGGVAGSMLKRIIVVSHHEDLAAAFPVSYRLESTDGLTKVTRLG